MMAEQADLLRQAHDSLAAAKILNAQSFTALQPPAPTIQCSASQRRFSLVKGWRSQGIVACTRPEEFFALAERLIGPLPPPDQGHS